MIEVSLTVLGVRAEAPTEEALKGGADPEIFVQVIGATFLPFEAAPGQGPMPVPSVAVKFALSKESALKLGKKLVEQGEKLPNKARIDIAQNLSGVDEAQEVLDGLKKFS